MSNETTKPARVVILVDVPAELRDTDVRAGVIDAMGELHFFKLQAVHVGTGEPTEADAVQDEPDSI